MLKQIDEEVEYIIYEIVDGERKMMERTTNREEAQMWFDAGKIIYEVRKTATQTEWLTIVQEMFYEWHQE